MPSGENSGYLPGDPRFGLDAEELREYYRSKPAQWAIYCWDNEGMSETRNALLEDQKNYIQDYLQAIIGYGHFVSDTGLEAMGTSFFVQLSDRSEADNFIAKEPMNKAGVFEHIVVHRWSNSFLKRQADYQRKGMQQFLCTGSKTAASSAFYATHLKDHENYFAKFGENFIFRGPIRSADGVDNIGTALLLELPDIKAAEQFWNNEPFVANGGYGHDSRIYRWVFGD